MEALSHRVPGISLTDVQGNAFVQDLRYRGFAASPLQGTPQGIAVYQNGMRINEAFGDTVNWDLIPTNAISQSPGRLKRFYGDIGRKGDKSEIHISGGAGSNLFGVVGPTGGARLNVANIRMTD